MSYTKEKKGKITVYHMKKIMTDEKIASLKGTHVTPAQIELIIDHDADVYGENDALLLKFRKGVLPKEHVDAFYDAIIKFAHNKTDNRKNASGHKNPNAAAKTNVMSNIFGYFDKWTPNQKLMFSKNHRRPKIDVRETRFNMDYPELYKKTIPLIEDVDHWYEKTTPEFYKNQKRKARQTPFKVGNTVFTTITTNLNYQTALHTDKGDDAEGFGNLAVIERGEYTGGETCMPQYGVGVDVRTGDVLFMDVHQYHTNLPIVLKTPDAQRLSIVCYLRTKIWEASKGMPKSVVEKHNKTVRLLTRTLICEKNKKNKTVRFLKRSSIDEKNKTKKRNSR